MNNRNNKRRNNRSNRKGPKPKDNRDNRDSRDNRQNQSGSSSGSKGISGIRSVSTNVTKEKSSRASVSTNTANRPKEQKSSKDRRNRRDRRETKEAREARERANKKKNILKKFNIFNKSSSKPPAKRRGGAGRLKALQRKKIVLYKVSSTKSSTCPICNKMIKNMNNALVDEQSGDPAHFDCIFDTIKTRLSPGKGQRVVYVGAGGFALIEDVRENGRDKFKIVEKVQYNNKKTVK